MNVRPPPIPEKTQSLIKSCAIATFALYWIAAMVIALVSPTAPDASSNEVVPIQDHGTRYVVPVVGLLYNGGAFVAIVLFVIAFYLWFAPAYFKPSDQDTKSDK